MGLPPHTPAGNIVPCTLSSLRGGLKKGGEGWGVSPADSARGTPVSQTSISASRRLEIRKNRGCQANDNDISRKNEAFVPEGFQRAMRQTGAVNARKALWWGDGAKPHIYKRLDICFLKCSV